MVWKWLFGKKDNKTKKFRIFDSIDEIDQHLHENAAIQVKIENLDVCVVKTPAGIFALENRCPHQNAPLHRGKCKRSYAITCPYHGMEVDLQTGALVGEEHGEPAKVFKTNVGNPGLSVEVPEDFLSSMANK